MKTLHQVIMLSLFLGGFANQLVAQEASKLLSDSELRQKVVGVWNYTSDVAHELILKDIYTFAPNGNYAKQASLTHNNNTKTSTGFGTWQIQNGSIVITVTRITTSLQGSNEGNMIKGGITSRLKIVSIDEHALVFENNPTLGTESQNPKSKYIKLTK